MILYCADRDYDVKTLFNDINTFVLGFASLSLKTVNPWILPSFYKAFNFVIIEDLTLNKPTVVF